MSIRFRIENPAEQLRIPSSKLTIYLDSVDAVRRYSQSSVDVSQALIAETPDGITYGAQLPLINFLAGLESNS